MRKKPAAKKPNLYIARPGAHISQKDVDVIAPYLHETLFPDGNFDKEVTTAPEWRFNGVAAEASIGIAHTGTERQGSNGSNG